MPRRHAAAAAILAGGFVLGAALPAPAGAQPVAAPAGAPHLMTLGADGVQVYACEPQLGGVAGAHAWVFKGPEALLFDAEGRQVGTHGAGPFWRLAADNSAVVAQVAGNAPAPQPGAIPWLLLRARSHEGDGPMRAVAWIRRVDTVGGLAPRAPCDASAAGAVARMRYSALYEFFGAGQ